MTRMMVRITDAAEAGVAAAASVDAIDFVVPRRGGRDTETARAVRSAFPGTFRLSFAESNLTFADIDTATQAGADEVAFTLSTPEQAAGDAIAEAIATATDRAQQSDLTVVAVLGAASDFLGAVPHVRGRVGAAMLDAGATGRLIDQTAIGQLDAFATSCRASQLPFGLAGGLEAPDVARLLLLHPDILGFDNAVRHAHRLDSPLDPLALDAIRGLIPRAGTPRPDARRFEVVDRIFVRDFVVPLAIGAYQAEHGARQRVKFSVEADVKREPVPPRDMRDVFSYDVILETIRVLSQRAHVTFVETLAEEVAVSLLAHADVTAVTIKVEKLDVIDGAVGIEIRRGRR